MKVCDSFLDGEGLCEVTGGDHRCFLPDAHAGVRAQGTAWGSMLHECDCGTAW